MTDLDIIKQCTTSGKVVHLPAGQLDRKLYTDVAKRLQGIGGKWSTKARGFVFDIDPAPLLCQVAGGEKINLKQTYQFFETPREVADFMASHLFVETDNRVLEPSAGKGALIDAVIRENAHTPIDLFFIEQMPTNILLLNQQYGTAKNLHFLHPPNEDFLQYQDGMFDRIIANPPFTKNQDIDHVYKMWECLKPTGRIVTIMSTHWQFANGKKETAFRQWVEDNQGETYKLDGGTFKASGTIVASILLIIDKP